MKITRWLARRILPAAWREAQRLLDLSRVEITHRGERSIEGVVEDEAGRHQTSVEIYSPELFALRCTCGHGSSRAYMTALLAFNEELGRPIYADANGTLRISFGVVMGSMPKDGLMYDAFTTLEGVAAKHRGEDPFDAPEEELRLIAERDHGPYYHPLYQSVPVNFLCTLDITGGNSGSPVLNARGNLVGLAFDGTYEGIISDWAFDGENARTIAVDVRYMLWVMAKLDGATRLLEEMGVADFKRLAHRKVD